MTQDSDTIHYCTIQFNIVHKGHCDECVWVCFAFSQMDHDPRNPAYIATQGPLPSTVADFWQVTHCLVVCVCVFSVDGVKMQTCVHRFQPIETVNLIFIVSILIKSLYSYSAFHYLQQQFIQFSLLLL